MTADAVVIGAGHNGLVAANLLADAGWDVMVLEAAPAPGGAVRSAEVAATGFRSDLCSALFPFAACSPVFAGLRLDHYGLRWLHAPQVLCHPLPDGRAVTLYRDPQRTAESVADFAELDARRWLELFRDFERIGDTVLDTVFTPFPPLAPAVRLLRRDGADGVLRRVRQLAMSVRELGEQLFAGEGARLLLTGTAMHTDLSPESAGSAAYGWLLAMVGQQYGFPAPLGGAQSITDALMRRLHSRGGVVVCDAPVDKVVVIGGSAYGVITADGRRFRARRAVLADVTAPRLYLELVGAPHLPAALVDDLEGFRFDPPTLKVDWALDGPVPWSSPQPASAPTVHLGGDTAQLSRTAAELASGSVPRQPFVLVGQMSVVDATRSPAGTSTLWAYTHLPRRCAGLGRDDDEVAGQVARIEQLIDEYAPGFTRLVRGRYVQGPAELEAENASLVGGALGAGTSAPSQLLMFRPVPGLGRADTPIDRLYLAGASAHPGPGVHGGPGANAARAALRRSRMLTGGLYRAGVDLGHRLVY